MKSSKKWTQFNFDSNEEPPPKRASCKKGPQEPVPAPKRPNFNFGKRLEPQLASDLAVHPKKIKEIESWLQRFVLNSPQNKTASYLLMTGPAGCGKSSTVKVLCKSMNIAVTEWINPINQDYERGEYTNPVAKFAEFLSESKYKSLFSKSEKKVVLVEEFPNAFNKNPEQFLDILEECYYKTKQAVVFICTDSFDNGSNISQVLFPAEIQQKLNVAQINFNSCAVTLMKSALKRAHNLIQDHKDLFRIPSGDTVDAIVATSMGDIRSAMNQYYFASLSGCSELPSENKSYQKAGNKRKRNNPNCVTLMSRDENLGLFHGLGRVLNPKLNERGKLNCDVEKLVDEFTTQPGIFTWFLHENYLKYFGDLGDVCNAIEILSLSQVFLEKWMDGGETLVYALWVSVLGLMIFNKHKVSQWNQIRGPKKIKKRVNVEIETRNLQATDLFYYNVIRK